MGNIIKLAFKGGSMAKLEICCYGIDCALIAQNAGADRVELCAAPREGGLTPSAGVLLAARDLLQLPVHPIIRPRGGDFCYSSSEFAIIKSDIDYIRDLGFPGFAVGVLNEDAHIDVARMRQIVALAGNMAITFHRAFDLCHNPKRSLQALADLGIARILTSGQQQTAESGLALLRELTMLNAGPIIMAGAGVRLANLQKFSDAGIKEVHSSVGQRVATQMHCRKAGVSMSSEAENDDLSHHCVDGEMIEAMKSVLNQCAEHVA